MEYNRCRLTILGHEEGRIIGALDLYREALRIFRYKPAPHTEEAAQARVFTLDELVAIALAGGQSVAAPLEAEERIKVAGAVDRESRLVVYRLERFIDILEHLLEVGLAVLRAGQKAHRVARLESVGQLEPLLAVALVKEVVIADGVLSVTLGQIHNGIVEILHDGLVDGFLRVNIRRHVLRLAVLELGQGSL